MSGPRDESISRLKAYLEEQAKGTARGLGERVQGAVLGHEAGRLVGVLEGLAAGELRGLALHDAWDVLQTVRESATVRETVCVLRCDELRRLDPGLATKSISAVLGWLAGSTRRLHGSLFLGFESETDLMKDQECVELVLRARRAGWRVAVGGSATGGPAILVRMRTATEGTVSLTATPATAGDAIVSLIRFKSDADADAEGTSVGPLAEPSGAWQDVWVPEVPSVSLDEDGGMTSERSTVSDLFGDLIMLRDLEPRAAALDGIGVLRADLGWDALYTPRKNEPDYARVLMRIMAGVTPGGPEQIVYVGDTLLNDGGAIRGLQRVGPQGGVWGFLCGATRASHADDIVLGRVYFGARWGSLVPFLRHAAEEGLALNARTYVLFDLDQTVYAAKGRDDEPLIHARWDAAREYLEAIVPAYKFDPARAEALYREFDDDRYHPVTRDNLDYVILLVLAVSAGLADASEIRSYASSTRPSIGALAEELRRRASMRVGHEDVFAVLDAIKAIYYNTLAGDQTPCKDFRRFECLAMARRMRGEDIADTQTDHQIVLNREVTDTIHFLRSVDVTLMAVSDRPVEAAVVDDDGDDSPDATDLMVVPMATRGVSIRRALDLHMV